MVYILFLILWVGTHFAMDHRVQMVKESEILHVDEIIKSRRRDGQPEYIVYKAQLSSGDTAEVSVYIPGAGLLPGLSAARFNSSGIRVEMPEFPVGLYEMVLKKYHQQGSLKKS